MTERIARSIFVTVFSAILGLANIILLSRGLGPSEFGTYSFSLTGATVVVFACSGGLGALLVREVAAGLANGRYDEVRGIIRSVHIATLCVAFLIVLVFGCIIFVIRDWIEPERMTVFAWAIVLAWILTFALVQASILRGLDYVVAGQIPDLLVRPALMATLVGFWLFLHGASTFSARTAMVLHVIAALCALIVATVLCARYWPDQLRASSPVSPLPNWKASAMTLTAIYGLHAIVGSTDVLMLGILADDKSVGIYRVSLQCALLITAVIGAIAITVQPQIAELYAKGDKRLLQGRIVAVNRAALFVAIAAALFAAVLGEPVLGAIFGQDYVPAAPALIVLALGQLAYGLCGPAIHILNMTGHEREAIKGLAIGVSVNALGCLALIPFLKQEGAAIAAALALACWQVALARRVNQLTGLVSWQLFNQRRGGPA